MTIDEFLDKLSETPRDWYYTEEGRIRRRRYGLQIQCPITALCDKDFLLHRECAHQLGLSDNDRTEIIQVADLIRPVYDHDLRVKLLKACGLEELSS